VVVEDIAEADALARLFIEHQEWERAWAKAFEFPFSASLQLLRALAGQGWQPSGADEQAALAELTSLVQTELEISPEELWKQLPAGVLRARVNLLAGRINAVAFAPHQPVLAVGASTRKAVVWDFQRGQRTELLRGFAHSIGQVAYSADGQLLVAERTNGRIACAVYVQRGENAVPVWQCAGPVTALEAKPNQDYDSPVQMISTGRDGAAPSGFPLPGNWRIGRAPPTHPRMVNGWWCCIPVSSCSLCPICAARTPSPPCITWAESPGMLLLLLMGRAWLWVRIPDG
jgi:hypothetical protein